MCGIALHCIRCRSSHRMCPWRSTAAVLHMRHQCVSDVPRDCFLLTIDLVRHLIMHPALHQEPLVAATLADITCDSDGKLDKFVSAREGVDFDPILPLHQLEPGSKYYLAMFLTGEHGHHTRLPAVLHDADTGGSPDSQNLVDDNVLIVSSASAAVNPVTQTKTPTSNTPYCALHTRTLTL